MSQTTTRVVVWVRKAEGYRIQRAARARGLYADVSNSPHVQQQCSMTQAEAVEFHDCPADQLAVLTVELAGGVRFADLAA